VAKKPNEPRKRVLPSGVAYNGPLAEPISPSFLDVALGTTEQSAYPVRMRKLGILMGKYGIDESDPEAWMKLALWLSLDHVPGMQIVSRRLTRSGRPKTWKAGLGERLVLDVGNLCAKKKLATIEAIRWLKKNSPDWKRFTVQNLEVRHREAARAQQKRVSIDPQKSFTLRFFDRMTKVDDDALRRKFASMTFPIRRK
jgi:hypothetical protein